MFKKNYTLRFLNVACTKRINKLYHKELKNYKVQDVMANFSVKTLLRRLERLVLLNVDYF